VRLRDLLGAIDVLDLRDGAAPGASDAVADPDPNPPITAVAHDSRRVVPGALFCCVPGRRTDGHDHAEAAVAAGAVALLVERFLPLAVAQVRVPDVRRALGPLAQRFHGDPSAAMTVLGVTGTNGKTTVTYLLDAIARAAGLRSAVIGTTGVRVGGASIETGFTTPEATDLQALLAQLRDEGVQVVAMEVSSHALVEHRVDGVQFRAVGFTNLGRDHLDLHGSVEEYRAAKARLFSPRFAPVAIVRRDGDTVETRIPTVHYRSGAPDDLWARDPRARLAGSEFTLVDTGIGPAGPGESDLALHLPGAFNVENALCAAGLALAVGIDRAAVVQGLGSLRSVPGRMERVDAARPFSVFVDYAHTPDGLATVLDAARASDATRVLALFGCGGDRDPDKREPMGRAVGERADFVVLTSDNPRSEDPAAIAAAAERGLRAAGARYEVELDRRAAIRKVLAAAGPGDVVLVLGKGSETGQTAGGVTVPFDDRAVVREELEASA
jgi:UDP-N-acetylmuramoyl-L-alanyl-D-glutamate--2,6-diaminopimelate ligase